MSILLEVIGVLATSGAAIYFLLRDKEKSSAFADDTDENNSLQGFKDGAYCVKVDLDNCRFKDRSYFQEVEQVNLNYSVATKLVGSPAGLFYTPLSKEKKIQSVLFYQNKNVCNNRTLWQVFSVDEITLKYHVLSGNVKLYINRNDDSKYFFELIRD